MDIDDASVLDLIPLSRYHCMLLFIIGSIYPQALHFLVGARSWKLRHCFGAFTSSPAIAVKVMVDEGPLRWWPFARYRFPIRKRRQ